MVHKLGDGKRFAIAMKNATARGARDPAAVAAHMMRKKYGPARIQRLSTKSKQASVASPERKKRPRDVPL